MDAIDLVKFRINHYETLKTKNQKKKKDLFDISYQLNEREDNEETFT